MDRLTLYQEVKKCNLQNEIQKKFGKNFTQVSSIMLEKMVNDFKNKKSKGKIVEKKKNESFSETKKQERIEKNFVNSPFVHLVEILHKKHLLGDSEKKELFNMLDVKLF